MGKLSDFIRMSPQAAKVKRLPPQGWGLNHFIERLN